MDDIFDPKNEVKTSFIKWGKVGDYIKGTLSDIREINSTLPGKEGQRVKIYEFLAQGGEFHRLDEATKQPIDPSVVINEGEYWIVGGRVGIDNQLRNVKIGTIVGLRFADSKPSKQKGFNPTKIIKVFLGGIDPNWMGQRAGDVTSVGESDTEL